MNNKLFACADLTVGQINAIVKKLGGYDGAISFLRGETVVVKNKKNWREEDGIIYFLVTSDGMSGEDWIVRLETKGFKVSQDAKNLLRSDDFKPTSGVTTEVTVIKGSNGLLKDKDGDLFTKTIYSNALKAGFLKPSPEVACLIRENFSDKQIRAMGLSCITIMHNPVDDPYGNPLVLSVHSRSDYSLGVYNVGRELGFGVSDSDLRRATDDDRNKGPFHFGWRQYNSFAFVAV